MAKSKDAEKTAAAPEKGPFDGMTFEELEASYKANARAFRDLNNLCEAQRGEINRRRTLAAAEKSVADAQAQLDAVKGGA